MHRAAGLPLDHSQPTQAIAVAGLEPLHQQRQRPRRCAEGASFRGLRDRQQHQRQPAVQRRRDAYGSEAAGVLRLEERTALATPAPTPDRRIG
jgi:hypothetical protein